MEDEINNPNQEEDFEKRKERLTIEKLEKEVNKIELETRDLKKSEFKKPQWYAALFPFFLGAATLIVAWQTGFLNNQAALNEIKADKVEKKFIEVQNSKDSLTKVFDSLSGQVKNMAQQLSKLKTEKAFVESEYNKIKHDNEGVSEQMKAMIQRLALTELKIVDTLSSVRDVYNFKINSWENKCHECKIKVFQLEQKLKTAGIEMPY